MEERRVAAIVLAIIAVIAIFFTAILPRIQHDKLQKLSYRNCQVKFYYSQPASDADTYRAAQNKLALCLCKVYEKDKKDTAFANKILEIYREYGSHWGYDSISFRNTKDIDSILKKRSQIFDTLILID